MLIADLSLWLHAHTYLCANCRFEFVVAHVLTRTRICGCNNWAEKGVGGVVVVKFHCSSGLLCFKILLVASITYLTSLKEVRDLTDLKEVRFLTLRFSKSKGGERFNSSKGGEIKTLRSLICFSIPIYIRYFQHFSF